MGIKERLNEKTKYVKSLFKRKSIHEEEEEEMENLDLEKREREMKVAETRLKRVEKEGLVNKGSLKNALERVQYEQVSQDEVLHKETKKLD
jgi:hypothetical protein